MKRFFALPIMFALILGTLFSSNSSVYARELEDITLKEIEQVLIDNMKNNNIDIELGTHEYVEYLMAQQLEHQDQSLLVHPQYESINYYIGEYLYQLSLFQSDNPNEYMDTHFLNMTIEELKEKIKLRNEEEQQVGRASYISKSEPSDLSTMSTYSPSKAIVYAKEYAEKTNPKYKRYNLNCTNFVSQAIHAGGKVESKPSPVNKGMLETTTYWFNDNYMDCSGSNSCYMRDKTSTSWVRVTDFYSYWTKKGMKTVTSTNQSTIISNASVGDIIQFKNSSGWYHSVIVNRKANGTIYIASNTLNYYDKNFKVTDAVSYRVIKMR